jgi:FMN reductase
MSIRIVAVTAGLSDPSSTRLLADQLAAAVRTQVSNRGESAEVEFIELRELAVDLATTLVSGGLPTPSVAAAREAVARADGLIAVSPTFTASYSGLFKLFFDVLDPHALRGVPVLAAATGGSPRHSLVLDHALRPLFAYLGALVVPTGVFAATEDFGSDEAATSLASRVQRAAGELATQLLMQGNTVAGFAQDPSEGASADGAAREGGHGARPRSSGMTLGSSPDFASLLKGHDGTV